MGDDAMTLLALPEVADFATRREGMPTLDELADRTPVILRKQISTYLDTAQSTVASAFMKPDPRAPERGLVIGYSQLTDGVWAWSHYWAYLVAEYGVWIPDEFIEHMRAHSFEPPRLTLARLEELTEERADATVVTPPGL
jgi:hypothetical protein